MVCAHTDSDSSLGVATVPYRRLCSALVLLLLPVEFAASADPADWTDAPAEWIEGIDYSAFCKPGEWYFEAIGKQFPAADSRIVAKQQAAAPTESEAHRYRFEETSIASVLFGWPDDLAYTSDLRVDGLHGEPYAMWLQSGPKPDELTRLRIARNDAGTVILEAFAGTTMAAWRVHRPRTSMFGHRDSTDTRCEAGRPLKLSLAFDGLTTTESRPAYLALAADGSLIANVTAPTVGWMRFVRTHRLGTFVRFPAKDAPVQPR
jgi:hypothetical protein